MKRLLLVLSLAAGCVESPQEAPDEDVDAAGPSAAEDARSVAEGDATLSSPVDEGMRDLGAPERPSPDLPPPPDRCGPGPQGLHCGTFTRYERPLPDCLEDVVVEPLTALESFQRPFELQMEVHERFRAVGRPGDAVRWQLYGHMPSGPVIDACSGELHGPLYWAHGLPFWVVAVVGEGPGCRMGKYEVPTAPTSCAAQPPERAPLVLPPGVFGEPYDASLGLGDLAGGGRDGYIRLVGGERPRGLTVDCVEDRIAGTPWEVGEFVFEVEWIDGACSEDAGLYEIHLRIDEGAPPCGGCPEGEICTQYFDGGCTMGIGCRPNPLGCQPGVCTEACAESVCGDSYPWACMSETCGEERPDTFLCYGI